MGEEFVTYKFVTCKLVTYKYVTYKYVTYKFVTYKLVTVTNSFDIQIVHTLNKIHKYFILKFAIIFLQSLLLKKMGHSFLSIFPGDD